MLEETKDNIVEIGTSVKRFGGGTGEQTILLWENKINST